MRCPDHNQALVYQESYTDSVLVGGSGWQSEQDVRVTLYICPADGCLVHRKVAR